MRLREKWSLQSECVGRVKSGNVEGVLKTERSQTILRVAFGSIHRHSAGSTEGTYGGCNDHKIYQLNLNSIG